MKNPSGASVTESLIKTAGAAAAGVVVVTALPVFGAVGAITATGVAVASIAGAGLSIAEDLLDSADMTLKDIFSGLGDFFS